MQTWCNSNEILLKYTIYHSLQTSNFHVKHKNQQKLESIQNCKSPQRFSHHGIFDNVLPSRSHGSVRVVRTTSKVNGKCWSLFDPQTTHEPFKRSSPNLACVITSWISPARKKLGPIRWVVSSPHIGEIYTQMFPIRMFTTFFGTSTRLQPRRLHGF